MLKSEYPLKWRKDDFEIKIFCSIPNIATGILLKAGDANLVIDPGDGILRDLKEEIGTEKILSISDVFISHGHHDHLGGVWSLLTYLRVMGKRNHLSIFFPKGCVEIKSIYQAFTKVYSKSLPYKIRLKEIENYNVFSSGKVKIKPFPVIHKEFLAAKKIIRRVPAIGFKFIYKNKVICYGGDTAYCEELVKHARSSDLAIIEAGHFNEKSDDMMHMTIDEAVKVGSLAKDFFLVHVPE
jgi:ribonuclease Z